jgi:hypothetical protein
MLVLAACARDAAPVSTAVAIRADVPEFRTVQVVHGRNGRSDVRCEDIHVRTNTWEPVPTIIDSTASGPWVMSHDARVTLAGDPSGSQGWLIDNAVLVEVLDIESHRLAAALVGNTETMVLDGEPVQMLGAASFRPGPTDVTALFPEVGTPFLLRVTALDYGGEAYSTDVWLVVGPAEMSTRDRAPVVPDRDPIEHGAVPGQEQVSPTRMGEARPIDQQRWAPEPMRVVLEATICEYRVTWNGWDPPRTSEFHPDGAGWINDYFISGSDQNGQVFWNVIAGEVRVRPRPGQELSPGAAPAIAAHAAATIFPGIDLDTLIFDPRPCPGDAPCTPY